MNISKKIFLISSFLSGCLIAGDGYMKRQNLHIVFLAGGTGTRLWPLSTKKKPKQLLTLNSEKTLLEQTIDRVRPLVHSNDQLWVTTTQEHAAVIKDCLKDSVGNYIIEGASRNSGPAVIYSCKEIYKKDPTALVLFLPADAYIPDYENGRVLSYIESALNFVSANERISLFGMTPTRPETGFGYIEFDRSQGGSSPFFKVKKFHEKPNKIVAQEYLESGMFAWNITMCCAQVKVMLDECKKVSPDLVEQVNAALNGNAKYADIDSIAIEPALMEKSNKIWVLPVAFEWCDVGNVGVFLSLKNSLKLQQLVQVDAHNNLVDVPGKVVALVGVHDLCVVQTETALLIIKRDDAEKVRSVVQQLQQNGLAHYL